MIDSFFIESAKRIRKDFLLVDSKLTSYQGQLRSITESILGISKKLEEIKSQVGKKPINVIQNDIFKELGALELEAKKIEKLVNPLNNKMEKLRKEEEDLWNKIKKKYPSIKDEDLIAEIHKHIEK